MGFPFASSCRRQNASTTIFRRERTFLCGATAWFSTEQQRVFAHGRLLGNPVALFPKAVLAEIEFAIKYVLDLA